MPILKITMILIDNAMFNDGNTEDVQNKDLVTNVGEAGGIAGGVV